MGMRKNPDSTAGKIREYILAYPNAKPKDVAQALECNVQSVYAVRAANRKSTRRIKAAMRKVKKASTKPTTTKKVLEAGLSGTTSVDFDRAADLVNHPAHYTFGGIETIDFIKAKLTPEEFRGYLKGNVLKYGSRLGHKGDMKTDAGKLSWYSSRLKEVLDKS